MFSVSWILVVTSCSWRKNKASKVTPRLSGGSCCESKKACESRCSLRTAFMACSWGCRWDTRSQLELLPHAQPADVVRHVGAERLRLVEALDLGHDQVGFGRLGVG